jgi:hypothetical protein
MVLNRFTFNMRRDYFIPRSASKLTGGYFAALQAAGAES